MKQIARIHGQAPHSPCDVVVLDASARPDDQNRLVCRAKPGREKICEDRLSIKAVPRHAPFLTHIVLDQRPTDPRPHLSAAGSRTVLAARRSRSSKRTPATVKPCRSSVSDLAYAGTVALGAKDQKAPELPEDDCERQHGQPCEGLDHSAAFLQHVNCCRPVIDKCRDIGP